MILEFDPADIPALKSRLVDGPGRSIHWATLPDIEQHFAHMRQDFVGLPELCYLHGKLIALIRRRLELTHTVPAFLNLWAAETEFLVAHLNSRWLVSACDTMAFCGNPFQRSNAAILSALFHTLQVCETERLVMRDSSHDPAKYAAHVATHRTGTHIPLWDGMKSDALEYGDSGRNMLLYVVGVLDLDPVIGPIARALISRALAADTFLGRLARLNSFFVPPTLSGGISERQVHVIGSINGCNIVQVDDKFLVVPQALGPIDPLQPQVRTLPGIVETESIVDAVGVASAGARV